jgi:hypothetical protein
MDKKVKCVYKNNSYVKVTPEMPLNILTQESPERTIRYCKALQSEIKRHCDVDACEVVTEYAWEYGNMQFDSLYDLLLHEIFEGELNEPWFAYYYERPSDNGIGSRGTVHSFKELVEEAFENPWNFTVEESYSSLAPESQEFLNKVIEFGLKNLEK